MKRLLSGLLSLVMVFSLTPSTIAFADDEDNSDFVTQSEEGTGQETNDSSEKIGGAETTSESEENSGSVDLSTMSSDELFEYLLNVDDMDALYDKYPNLNDLISKLSEDQQSQLANKFGNSEEDVNLVDNNTDNEAQLTSNNSNGDDSTVASGTCGEDLTWTLDSDGTLTINGTGKMYDYEDTPPWVNYNIANIKIDEGVTSVGDNAFSNDDSKFNIDSVLIPSTVRNIGSYAFYNNKNLTTITLPENLETIGLGAFNNCTSLQSITIPSNVTTIEESTFFCCTSLQSITIPSSVTTIGNYAFLYCTSLQSVTILPGIKSIGDNAFANCTSLKSIDIPSDVTTIGNYAFFYCTSLQSITIPSSVVTVGQEPFYRCSNVTNIYFNGTQDQWNNISENVLTEMGTTKEPTVHCLFVATGQCGGDLTWTLDNNGTLAISGEGKMYDYNDTSSPWAEYNVKNIIINEGVTSIGNRAFCNDNSKFNINNVVIPSTVTSIGSYAFYGNKSLNTITLPEKLETIGSGAFSTCTSLKSIDIPSSVETIGEGAFCDCNSLTSITIPDSVTTIGGSAFVRCSSLQNITIPSSVTTIGANTFEDCTSLKSIDIPSNVTTIGRYAFLNCTNLQSITLYNTLTVVDNNSFYGCSNVKDIYFYGTQSQWDQIGTNVLANIGTTPNVHCLFVATGQCGENLTWTLESDGKLTISGTGTMYNYDHFDSKAPWAEYNVKNIIINEGVTSIGDDAFYNNNSKFNITNVVIPSTVTSIGSYAFYYNNDLTTITLPEKLETIGNGAFDTCTSLKSIDIPSSVKTIGKIAFNNCANLANVTIQNGVISIGYGAFGECSSLTSITIPDSVTSIGQYVFMYSVKLENVSLPCRFKNAIDNTWFNGTKVTSPIVREHELAQIIKKDATCTEDGYEEYWQCKKCQRMFTDQSEKDEIYKPIVINAGHKYGKVEYTWSTDYTQCTATRVCEKGDDTQTETVDSSSSTTSPSCTEAGLIVYEAQFKNDAFEEQTKEGTIPATGHDLKPVAQKNATCTEDGYQAYWKCETCKKMFSDADGKTEIKEPSPIKATGHKLTEHKKVNATCETEGHETYWQCKTCKDMFSDKEGKNKIDEIKTIPATGHDYSKDWTTDVEPTCTKEGSKSHHCSRCESKSEITTIPKLDHNYDEGTITTDPTCTKTGIKTYKCQNCDATKEEVISATGHKLTQYKRVNATCETAGHEAYWKCETCKDMFSDAEGKKKLDKVVTIPATGHKYGEVTYTWSSDHKKCTATRECETCHDKDTETVNSTSKVIRDRSCTETELTKYSVTFTNDAFKVQTTEVETADAKGHSLTKVDEIKATCENTGSEAYWECSDCHKKFSDKDGNDEIESLVVIKALGHKLTEVKKVGATCTTAGSEAYWKCDTCGSMFSDSEGNNKIDKIVSIPATGHSLTKVSKQDSTASKEGNITYWYCDECDKYYSDEKAEKEIKKADTVIAKVAPVIIKGDGVTVTVGEKKELSFTSDASYDDFIRAEVDGKILDSDNYTVKSGSTIVTLKSDYVASLEEGEHTLSIVSQSGTATAHFTVSKKKADPETKKSETTNTTKKSDSKQSTKKSTNTGVQSNMGLYISLIMISMLGLVVLVRRRSEQ